MASTHSDQRSAQNPIAVAARFVVVFIRLYLGAWMLLNGLNHFLPVFPQPMGGGLKSSELMVSLIETGLFGVVKSAEIVIGILLLFDLFVPVALVMSMPISAVVYYNAFVGGRMFTISMASGCLVWTIFLLLAYLPYYLPMLRLRAELGRLSDLARLPGIFVYRQADDKAPESAYRLPIAVGGLILTAYLAYDLHPHTPQVAGAGQTPATIVEAYIKLAYDDGKLAQAEQMYFSPDLARDDHTPVLPADGQPFKHKVINMIAQGPNVVVHQLVSSLSGDLDVVDIYRVERSLITAHDQVSGVAAVH